MDYPYDLGPYSRTVTTASAGRPALVRPRPQLVLRLPPRGGGRLLREGAGGRPELRHGALGRRLRRRAELQLPLGIDGPRRQGRGARPRLRRRPRRARAGRRRHRAGTRADRGAARPLSAARPDRRPAPVERRLRRRHAPSRTRRIPTISTCAASSSKRSSTARPGACGTRAPASPRPAPARSRRARCWKPPSATCPGAMDHPGLLHLHVHLMEMSPHPEAALVTGDRLREMSPRHGPPGAHADPHRHPMRPLPRRDALEPEGHRRRPQVLRPRRADEFLLRLPHPQLPLRRLRGDVPRPVRARHRRRRRTDRDHARGVAAHPLAADGRFLRELRRRSGSTC